MTDNHLLLYRLAELMLQHEQHMLPVDLLFDDEQIGDFVKSIQIDSPYQQMLLEGVLTESVREEKLYVSFTLEGFFHYLLGELLFKLDSENRYIFLKELVNTSRLAGINGGVVQCLIKCAINEKYDPILYFIDSDNTKICIQPLATAFINGELPIILRELLKVETDSDFAVILDVIVFLKNNGKKTVVNQIILFFVDYFKIIDFNDINYFRQKLKIILLNSVDVNRVTLYVDSIINEDGKCFQYFDQNRKQLLLFELNGTIIYKGLLSLANRFASHFKLYLSDVDIISDNYYNLIYPLLELGYFDEAEMLYLRCKTFNKTNPSFLNWSGFIYQSWYEFKSKDHNHLNQGLNLYYLSSKYTDEAYGVYSIKKCENLENIGYSYLLLNQYDKAIYYLNKAIYIVIKIYNSKIVYQLGNLYEMLAVALNDIGRYNEALSYTFLSDECKLIQVSFDGPEMAWNHYDRAKIFLNLNEREKAIESMRLSFLFRKKSLGDENHLTILAHAELNKIQNDL